MDAPSVERRNSSSSWSMTDRLVALLDTQPDKGMSPLRIVKPI